MAEAQLSGAYPAREKRKALIHLVKPHSNALGILFEERNTEYGARFECQAQLNLGVTPLQPLQRAAVDTEPIGHFLGCHPSRLALDLHERAEERSAERRVGKGCGRTVRTRG